ncbi:MAG: putative peptidoglycan binding domain-containing protein [Bacteroidota bacterium]
MLIRKGWITGLSLVFLFLSIGAARSSRPVKTFCEVSVSVPASFQTVKGKLRTQAASTSAALLPQPYETGRLTEGQNTNFYRRLPTSSTWTSRSASRVAAVPQLQKLEGQAFLQTEAYEVLRKEGQTQQMKLPGQVTYTGFDGYQLARAQPQRMSPAQARGYFPQDHEKAAFAGSYWESGRSERWQGTYELTRTQEIPVRSFQPSLHDTRYRERSYLDAPRRWTVGETRYNHREWLAEKDPAGTREEFSQTRRKTHEYQVAQKPNALVNERYQARYLEVQGPSKTFPGYYLQPRQVICDDFQSTALVRSIQQKLKQKGYYLHSLHGRWDRPTQQAFFQYQKRNNFPELAWDIATLESLHISLP